MLSNRVRSTTSNDYVSSLKRFRDSYLIPASMSWHSWCSLSTISKTHVMINYIIQLRCEDTPTRGSIDTFVRAISWHHHTKLTNDPDPSTSPAIRDLRDAIERSFPDTPIHRRFPFSKNQLRSIACTAYHWAVNGRPDFYRLFVLIILSYKAASRISELLLLTRRDILLTPELFRLNLITRKNKKRRDPSLIYIANDPDSAFCPHKILSDYLAHIGILTCPPGFQSVAAQQAFLSSFVFPGGFVDATTQLPTGPISYTRVYDQLVELLLHLGINPEHFGWHSPRSSAITDMKEAGLSDEAIAAHTGHRDVASLRIYAQGTIPSRLKASQSLSLR
jgi:integrase